MYIPTFNGRRYYVLVVVSMQGRIQDFIFRPWVSFQASFSGFLSSFELKGQVTNT